MNNSSNLLCYRNNIKDNIIALYNVYEDIELLTEKKMKSV